jgi:ADP-ribosylglycohydrolase
MKLDGPPAATLTGLAVGDSLGMPFETMSRFEGPLLVWNGWFEASKYHKLDAGQWTDDTQMATALAESLLFMGTYSPAEAAKRYLKWHTSGDCRGQGGATGKAMAKLKAGLTWAQSGTPNAEGNGSAMRVAPMGLFFHRNIEAAVKMARVDSRITHGSLEAEVGAIAVAVGISLLAQHSATRDTLIHKVIEWTGSTGTQVHARLFNVLGVLKRDLSTNEKVVDTLVEMGTGGHVIQTVPAAFLAFCATRSFKDAIECAIRAGGDTDTVGAITGALAGTAYGIEQVARYLQDVEGAEQLRALERRLYAEGPSVYR